MKDVFLDNGIIKNILHKNKPQVEEQFWKTYNELNCPPTGASYISTPLMLLEYLGYEKQYNPLIFDQGIEEKITQLIIGFNGQDEDDLFNLLENEIENWFRSKKEFSKTELRKRYEEQLQWRSENGQEIARVCFGDNLDNFELTEKRFYWELAVDRMYAINFNLFRSAIENPSMQMKLLLSSLRTLGNPSFNVSFARVLQNCNIKNLDSYTKNYDLTSECVDTQLVHFASVGSKRNGIHYPVDVITTENPEGIRNRLSNYVTLLKRMSNFHFTMTNEVLPIIGGRVICIDSKTGMHKKTINLREIFERNLYD